MASATTLILVRPRRSLVSTAFISIVLGMLPVFGVLWGYIFLDEAIGWHTLTGAAVVLAGIVLVTGLSVRTLRGRINNTR